MSKVKHSQKKKQYLVYYLLLYFLGIAVNESKRSQCKELLNQMCTHFVDFSTNEVLSYFERNCTKINLPVTKMANTSLPIREQNSQKLLENV